MEQTEPPRPGGGDASTQGPRVYGDAPKVRNWGRAARAFALATLGIFAGLFVLSNRDPVPIDLVVTTVSIGLVWVLIAMFVAGWIGHVLWAWARHRAGKQGN